MLSVSTEISDSIYHSVDDPPVVPGGEFVIQVPVETVAEFWIHKRTLPGSIPEGPQVQWPVMPECWTDLYESWPFAKKIASESVAS
jgi:hypothetical protein